RTRFVQGAFEASTADAPEAPLSIVYLGVTVGADLGLLLARLSPRMVPGGVVFVEGVRGPLVERRVNTVKARLGMDGPIHRIDSDVVCWSVDEVPDEVPGSPTSIQRIPLVPPATGGRVDLSVIVILHNMRREAARSLTSLMRSYQRGVDDISYEVIVV